MSDTETIADILAEMREYDNTPPPKRAWLDLADRIEAAAARERNAHINDIHDALYAATGIPGDAAAMRAALLRVKEARGRDLEYVTLADIDADVDAALSAPPRNCDRFQTEAEAYSEFMGRFDHFNGERHYQYCKWLFAPAEGGAEWN